VGFSHLAPREIEVGKEGRQFHPSQFGSVIISRIVREVKVIERIQKC
jgi:hypothetical protein